MGGKGGAEVVWKGVWWALRKPLKEHEEGREYRFYSKNTGARGTYYH